MSEPKIYARIPGAEGPRVIASAEARATYKAERAALLSKGEGNMTTDKPDYEALEALLEARDEAEANRPTLVVNIGGQEQEILGLGDTPRADYLLKEAAVNNLPALIAKAKEGEEASSELHHFEVEQENAMLKAQIAEAIEAVDKSPAILWAGSGGAKERLLAILDSAPQGEL